MNHQFQAKVVAHSRNAGHSDIVTLQLVYPRFIHAEFMTHRMFSRNASSSRAIPVAKMIEQVRTNPAMPVHWGANRPGMQARVELAEHEKLRAQQAWQDAAAEAANRAEHLAAIGLHKQVANRVLEPFQLMSVVVTATEWENFFKLRDHEDAQPEIRVLAQAMQDAIQESAPVIRCSGSGDEFARWHLPYVSDEERTLYRLDVLLKLSTARCARVSYMNHDGSNPDPQRDIELHDALVGSVPIHASPTEHQACAMSRSEFYKNFNSWRQYRFVVEQRTGR